MGLGRKGFTLIEILISLLLLVIILGTIYSSFFTVNRAFKRFEDVSLRYQEVRTTLDIMRREIEGALFRANETDREKTRFMVKDRDIFGRPVSEIQFTSFSLRDNLPVRIRYFIEKEGDRLSLNKTVLPITPSGETGVDKGFDFEMLGEIRAFTIEILYNDRWVRTWDTSLTGRLPGVIRIGIEFNDNGRPVRLVEYARPMTGNRL